MVNPIKVGLKRIEVWHDDFEAEIRAYEDEHADKGQIVFYGPSNFTRWSARYGNIPLREALPGKSGRPCALNRGFGSSCPEHHLYFYSRLIRAAEPAALPLKKAGKRRSCIILPSTCCPGSGTGWPRPRGRAGSFPRRPGPRWCGPPW